LLGSPAAQAETNGPAPIKYAPLKQAPKPGVLRPGAVRHHTLVIVPLYKAALPDSNATHSMGAATKKFWEAEIPGLKLTVKYVKPTKFAAACNRIVNKAEAKAQSLAHISPWIMGNHILTYAPECNLAGLGSIRNGSGEIYIGSPDPDASMLAHEFGHNLGLYHADLLTCTRAGKQTSLARNCDEREYMNHLQIMGNGALVPGVRVGPYAQSLITGRVTSLDARRGGTATLNVSSKGQQAAMLKTPLGLVYFGATRDIDPARHTSSPKSPPTLAPRCCSTRKSSTSMRACPAPWCWAPSGTFQGPHFGPS
jgi:hypothetical protein